MTKDPKPFHEQSLSMKIGIVAGMCLVGLVVLLIAAIFVGVLVQVAIRVW